MKTYYISKNGNQLGPFPVDEIQSMLMSGEIDGGDFCWTDGMEQWQSIQEWDAALRAEQEIKVPSAPHSQPLGPKLLKQAAYQAPQMKTPAAPRKGKGRLIVLVLAAIVMIGGVFWVLSHRAKKQQIAKNIDAATSSKPFVNSLGMKFVPVSIGSGPSASKTVLLSIWETRRGEFFFPLNC